MPTRQKSKIMDQLNIIMRIYLHLFQIYEFSYQQTTSVTLCKIHVLHLVVQLHQETCELSPWWCCFDHASAVAIQFPSSPSTDLACPFSRLSGVRVPSSQF